MSIEPETPRNQYAKREYYIRVIGRVPVNVPVNVPGRDSDAGSMSSDPDAESTSSEGTNRDSPEPSGLRLEGTPLCSIDVTMSHVAVMYAAGRLLDSIREPFNASVIRAEMDQLRDREEAVVSPEDYEEWKKAKYEGKCIDPPVPESMSDRSEARKSVPQCPYLCQLLFKSFNAGGKPGFWSGAREMVHRNGNDGVRNVRGRSGHDTLARRDIQTWFLYIDVSNPLQPRYAFMEEQNIISSTRLDGNGNRKPLRIFNAREHAYHHMIPESEVYSDAKRFGEPEWIRHGEGVKPTGHRELIKLPDAPDLPPEYKDLLVSRIKRAQEHPAVMRIKDFGWFGPEDAIKPDGSALLQGIWRYSLRYSQNGYSNSIFRILLDRGLAGTAIVIRSQAMDEVDHPDSLELEYSLIGLPEFAHPENLFRSAVRSAISSAFSLEGGILSVLDITRSNHPEQFLHIKRTLIQCLKESTSKGGMGIREEVLEWLSSGRSASEPGNQAAEGLDFWLESDYDVTGDLVAAPGGNYDEEMRWIQVYQGLCYRASVARERLSRLPSDNAPPGSNSAPHGEPALNATTDELWDSEFPGKALGDVANPAFDVSHFPRISEQQLLTGLQMWCNTIWLPNLGEGDWNFENSTPIPLRTLNVSGCHFVTRDTIRQALQIAPSITRIIMIGCKSFGDTDLMLLSLDGTLNNVDCILTSETTMDPFRNPRHKIQRRDDAYNQALELLPRAPNEKVQAKLDSVPGVFLNTTKEFKFQYSTKIYDTYYPKGLSSRSLSHSFARPPALGFDSSTGKPVCGPPRFSVILATHTLHDMPLTGATLPRVPIDTGIEGVGTNGSGLTSIWRGIIDLLELLGDPYIRNKQRWNLIRWSLVVKSCFSGPGHKWGKTSGLAGGGEFYGFPAYFKGGPGQANEEWMFVYQFRDVVARMQTVWANGPGIDDFIYPESSSQDGWAFIRYGRDANPLSHEIPTIVLYNVREFRQAICPDIPILEDEAKWIARVEDILTNGTWHPSYPIINWEIDREMACKGDPTWAQLREAAGRMTKPKYMKDVPQELMPLIERMMVWQMNAGSDPF